MSQQTLTLEGRIAALRRALRDVVALAVDTRHDIRTPEMTLDQIETLAAHALADDDCVPPAMPALDEAIERNAERAFPRRHPVSMGVLEAEQSTRGDD